MQIVLIPTYWPLNHEPELKWTPGVASRQNCPTRQAHFKRVANPKRCMSLVTETQFFVTHCTYR